MRASYSGLIFIFSTVASNKSQSLSMSPSFLFFSKPMKFDCILFISGTPKKSLGIGAEMSKNSLNCLQRIIFFPQAIPLLIIAITVNGSVSGTRLPELSSLKCFIRLPSILSYIHLTNGFLSSLYFKSFCPNSL